MTGWTDDLATGIAEVDEQHKEIFRRVDSLLAACKEGKGRQNVGGVIDFLGDYVVSHFRAEEAIQARSKYPRYAEHKLLHEEFIRSFAALKDEFDTHGPTLTAVTQTNTVVVQWLLHHIRKEDGDLARHIRETSGGGR